MEADFWFGIILDSIYIVGYHIALADLNTAIVGNLDDTMETLKSRSVSILDKLNAARNLILSILDNLLNARGIIIIWPTFVGNLITEIEHLMNTINTESEKTEIYYHLFLLPDIITHLELIISKIDPVEILIRKDFDKILHVYKSYYTRALAIHSFIESPLILDVIRPRLDVDQSLNIDESEFLNQRAALGRLLGNKVFSALDPLIVHVLISKLTYYGVKVGIITGDFTPEYEPTTVAST